MADVLSEHEVLADTICARLRDGSLPPDEAYWWTRILVEAAIDRLAYLSTVRPVNRVCTECGCSSQGSTSPA
jgi:hypothetical protein